MWYVIGAIAIIIIISLAFYAGQLLSRVKEQNQRQQAEQEKRLNYITSSIGHIAKAMKAEQCEFSEGVLRIWVLLDHYNSEQTEPKSYPELYPGFASLYDVIKDMPTHDARKKLSKQDRHKLDLVRFQAEKDYEEQIRSDIDKLQIEFTSETAAAA